MTAFLDANVVIRHLTGEPAEQAARATAALRGAESLLPVDLVAAEIVFVLESAYELERERVAELLRAISVADSPLLLRALEIYQLERLHFAESYLAACAEASGLGAVMSFDQAIDRLASVQRIEPGV